MDVETLYPSLDVDECGKSVRKMIETSSLQTEVNDDELALYLAVNMEDFDIEEERLGDLVKRRRHLRGRRPGITGQAVTGGKEARAQISLGFQPWGSHQKLRGRRCLELQLRLR